MSHRIHASAESKSISMLSRFLINMIKRDAVTELDMENLRSSFAITMPSTLGIDVERGKMPQVKITQEF